MKKALQEFKNTKNVMIGDWVLFIAISVFLFFCFIYVDILYTVSHANNMLSELLKGDFLGLYKVNYGLEVCGNFTTICYELPIYIIFIIWNIPTWIAQNFFNIDITSNFLSIIWMKTLLIVFLGACAVAVKNICKELKIKENLIKWVILIFISSPLVFSSMFILSQYDIITLFFMLLGIYSYIKGDYKKFILWFAIAIPLKLFALFVFIPLVLLKQKEILKILKSLVYGLSIFLISRVISMCMPYYYESTYKFNGKMLNRLLTTSTIEISLGIASLFLVAYLLLCIYCYMKDIKNKEELNKYAIYIPFASFALLFLLVYSHPYWLIYTTPFFAILIFMRPRNFKINLILDMGMSISALISQIYVFYWCYGAEQVDNMLLPILFGSNENPYITVKHLFKLWGINKYMPAVLAIYCATIIAMLIINRPKEGENFENQIKIERSVIWSRMLIIIPVATLMVACYFM